MKILITGGSSFTGYWFIRELAARGHTLTAIVRGEKDQYTGLRKERVGQIAQWADIVWNCSFGDDTFLQLLDDRYEVICHHGAQVENYKSPDFDIAAALHNNTLHVRTVMEKIKATGTRKLVLTGSVFEANEGSPPGIAFSPYGLSKTITWEIFRYWGWKFSLPLTKFVIPNPFGPYEEPRFCNYLMQSWIKGETPSINTPDYIRDNIHADLLATLCLAVEDKDDKLIEKIWAFRIHRVSGARLPPGLPEKWPAFAHCEDRLQRQTNFDEPLIGPNDALRADCRPRLGEKTAQKDGLSQSITALK